MKKTTKIVISVLAIGMTATAGYFLYKRFKRKKREKETKSLIPPARIEEIKQNPVSITNPPTREEISAVVHTQPSTIAITNKEEGDKFRNWINDVYPVYAKEIDLDRSGSFNNSYITKAWKKYGTEYTLSNGQQAVLGYVSSVVNNIANSKPVEVAGNVFTGAGNLLSGTLDKFQNRVPIKNESGEFDAETSAKNLYNSMRGWGTNEELFFSTLEPLTKAQRIQVREFYDTNGIGKSLGTLELSVRGEFSGGDLVKAIGLLELV